MDTMYLLLAIAFVVAVVPPARRRAQHLFSLSLEVVPLMLHGIYSALTGRIPRKKNLEVLLKYGKPLLLAMAITVLLAWQAAGKWAFLLPFVLVGGIAMIPRQRERFLRFTRRLPTSKIRSVAMGIAEIKGTLAAITPVYTPVGHKECIGYNYSIEQPKRDSKGKTYYVTVQNDRVCNDFMMADDTGEIRVVAEELGLSGFELDESYTEGGYLHKQYVLFAGKKMVLIGSVNVDAANRPFIEPDEGQGLFYMAPAEEVAAATETPRKHSVMPFFILLFLGFAFIAALTPIKLVGNTLTFGAPVFKTPGWFTEGPLWQLFNK